MYLFGGFTPANYASDVDEYSPGTDTWATVSQMPTPRSDLGAVEAGGSIYAIGGASAAASPDGTVEAYDPATDVWTAKAPMLTPRSHFAYAKGADGRIYAISGLTGTSFRERHERRRSLQTPLQQLVHGGAPYRPRGPARLLCSAPTGGST